MRLQTWLAVLSLNESMFWSLYDWWAEFLETSTSRSINCLSRLGPCKENEIFKLPNNNSSIPECFRNTCKSGLIMYREKCVELDSEEPCKEFTPYVGRKVYLVYKPSTGELICESEDQKYHCSNYCCKGHKRNVNDVCPGKPPRKTYPKVNRTWFGFWLEE